MRFFEIKKAGGTACVGKNGPRCKRCGQPTEIWRHVKEPTDRPYYRKWFRCANKACKTGQINPVRYYVIPDQPEESYEAVMKRCRAYRGPRPF